MKSQLTVTIGRSLRVLNSWIVFASSSLPVPVSPNSKTGASVAATRSASDSTRLIASLRPMIRPC